MKISIFFILIQYSIYLNCFFSNFDINVLCKNIATYKNKNYILFYCRERDGIDIYKYDLVTKNVSFLEHIKGDKNTIYFINFIGNTEILVKTSPEIIKIVAYKIHNSSRRFTYAKILKNRSSINEFTEGIFVDVNCDGYTDIVIPYSKYYSIYISVQKQKNISFKFLKKLYAGFVETVRQPAPYDNMWFKVGFALPKISSYKYRKICFNIMDYSSVGLIYIYKNNFKKRVAKIYTSRIKGKYEEFIVYPRPQPFIYCNNKCRVIHFANRKGVIYTTYLHYPYKLNEIQFVKGAIINFSHISKNIFWILYVPKMGLLGFYELLAKNTLEVKFGLVKYENNIFSMIFEIPLTVKISLKEEDGFITIQSSNFVCISEQKDTLEIAFSEKDAIYKYLFKVLVNKNKVDINEKLKMENKVKIFEKYECFKEREGVIIFANNGRIKYYEKK